VQGRIPGYKKQTPGIRNTFFTVIPNHKKINLSKSSKIHTKIQCQRLKNILEQNRKKITKSYIIFSLSTSSFTRFSSFMKTIQSCQSVSTCHWAHNISYVCSDNVLCFTFEILSKSFWIIKMFYNWINPVPAKWRMSICHFQEISNHNFTL